MNDSRKGSLLGIVLVLASLTLGWILISQTGDGFKQDPKKRSTVSHLRVVIQPTGPGGLTVSRNIDCPGKSEFCSKLKGLGVEDLRVPKGQICTQQYGGPSVAWITGTLNGKQVTEQISVKDGCQIALWNRLSPKLGLPRSSFNPGIS